LGDCRVDGDHVFVLGLGGVDCVGGVCRDFEVLGLWGFVVFW